MKRASLFLGDPILTCSRKIFVRGGSAAGVEHLCGGKATCSRSPHLASEQLRSSRSKGHNKPGNTPDKYLRPREAAFLVNGVNLNGSVPNSYEQTRAYL